MRLLFICLACIFVQFTTAFAQGGASPELILEFVEKDAEFNGGQAAMQKWIADHVKYPASSLSKKEQGRVYVSFVVEKNGTLTNIQVERGVSPALDAEAIRLLSIMPKWIPGMNGGKLIRQRCRIPINFSISDDEPPKKKKK